MKRAMHLLLATGLGCATALAGPMTFYARGDFNGWGLDNPMTYVGGVEYTVTIGGFSPGDMFEYKVATDDWSINAPGSNGRIMANASGEFTLHFYNQDTWSDGWEPSNKLRVGYDDPGMFAWVVMGSFNGWSAPVVTLTDMGNGLWVGDLVVATPGTYEWKFRKEDNWDISIGDDFGNAAANNTYTTTVPNEVIHFELDLPNGRWRAVPEPASLTLLTLGALAAVRRR